jgi:vitamin B12/bleomycin/antimicrobial peptide transport system ATP-binding/permease protein
MKSTEKPISPLRPRAGFWRDFAALARPYWVSRERWSAGGLLLLVVALTLGSVYVSVRFNRLNADLFNALQAMSLRGFYRALLGFAVWIAVYILVYVYQQYLTQALGIRWRRWMTEALVTRWLSDRTYYFWHLVGQSADNPDQRLTEDIGSFVDNTLSLSLGLLQQTVTVVTFVSILWRLSGSITVPLGHGAHLLVPGYMVWVCLIYTLGGSLITARIGFPLIKLDVEKQRFEADYRFSLVRLRENSEGVALCRGESVEQQHLVERFGLIFRNVWATMQKQKQLNCFTSFYNQIAIIFPYIVAGPRYFAKSIALGGMMQTVDAFLQLQFAISFFVQSYTTIAYWRSVIQRLTEFVGSMERSVELSGSGPGLFQSEVGDESLLVSDLSLSLPDGKELARSLNLRFEKGRSTLISGRSGVGKSTLLRAVSGIWPFATGCIRLPSSSRTMVLPQKPYLPIGTLRTVLAYPENPEAFAEQEFTSSLSHCRLAHLRERLDLSENWSLVLSPGEQQRIALARAFLHQPDWLFLDEATSALDESTEAALLGELRERLPHATIVSIGHRHSLREFHDTHYHLDGATPLRAKAAA